MTPETPDERRKQMRLCKIMYLEGKAIPAIVKETGVDPDALHHWIYSGTNTERRWKDIYDEQTQRMLDAIHGRSKRNIGKIWDVGSALIYNSLVARAAEKDRDGNPVPLNLREAKTVSEILTNFTKLRMADAGEPVGDTGSGSSLAPVTIDELKDAVLKDKFIDLIPMKKGVDFKETGNGTEGVDGTTGRESEVTGDGDRREERELCSQDSIRTGQSGDRESPVIEPTAGQTDPFA